MLRGKTGRSQSSSYEGERFLAFVPNPLPPVPAVAIEGEVQRALIEAARALGRLDGVSATLPDPFVFIYSYIRKEAVLSSQIEGTQSSLSDLILFEFDSASGAPLDDVREVSNYVAALEHGLERLNDLPLSNRLMREIHGILLSSGRGSSKSPGEFRRSQNWLNGNRPSNAGFVPPPPAEVVGCMGELERFLHAEDDGLDILVRAALAHVQFETIHPFLDGNGRMGRLLITFLLCSSGALSAPVLYLSLYFKQNRNAYYDLLDRVRRTGDWEAWLLFFLEGVRQTAEGAVATSQRLLRIFAEDSALLSAERRVGSALRAHQEFTKRPLLSIPEIGNLTGLSFPASSSAVEKLRSLGIVREFTGKRRGRVFAYDRYLATLNEGTELE